MQSVTSTWGATAVVGIESAESTADTVRCERHVTYGTRQNAERIGSVDQIAIGQF